MAKRIVSQWIEKPVNVERLAEELRLVLGDILVNIRAENGRTRISLLSPSPDDIVTATQIVQAHNANTLTDAQQTLQTIKDLIHGSVGKNVVDLTTPERWALLAGLLYQNRALTPDMTIRPPQRWIIKQDTDDD